MAWAELPKFMADGTKVIGHTLTSTCSGTGPSLDIARKVAINSCQSSAVDILADSVTFKSLIVQTEKDASLHSESSYSLSAKNLRCKPLAESVEQGEGFYQVYMKCSFDLKTVQTVPIEYDNNTPRMPSSIVAETKSITVSTIPQCEEILVRGDKPRVIKCSSNPTAFVLDATDSELIFRKSGKVPIRRSASDLRQDHSITIIFER